MNFFSSYWVTMCIMSGAWMTNVMSAAVSAPFVFYGMMYENLNLNRRI